MSALRWFLALAAASTAVSVMDAAPAVTLTIWTTPNYDWESKMMLAVEDIVVNIGPDHLNFSPKMFLRNGATVCPTGTTLSAACEKGCINDGRYCAVHYASDPLHENVLGSHIVMESARRECVWSIYGKPGNRVDMYWKYLKAVHHSSCDQSFSEDCVESTFANLGASPHLIDMCINKEGPLGVNLDSDNPLLEELLATAKSMKIHQIPAVYVNEKVVQVRGEGDALTQSLLAAVCAAYPQPKPLLCGCQQCTGHVRTCLEDAVCNGNNITAAPTRAPTTMAPTVMPTAAPVTIAPTAIIHKEDTAAKEVHEQAAAQAQAATVLEEANESPIQIYFQSAQQSAQQVLQGLSTLEIVLGGVCIGLLIGLCCVACCACRARQRHAAMYNQLIMDKRGDGRGPIVRIIPTANSDDEMEPYRDDDDDGYNDGFEDEEEGTNE